MCLADRVHPVTLLSGFLIAVGIVGLIVPVLPGLALSLLGVLLWAWSTGGVAWWFFAAACVVAAIGWIVQYTVPGKRMAAAGVPGRVILIGAIGAIVGFFVIPVVGLFVGFVVGVLIAELGRTRTVADAWTSTKHAVKAVVTSIAVELTAAVIVALIWVAGLLATR